MALEEKFNLDGAAVPEDESDVEETQEEAASEPENESKEDSEENSKEETDVDESRVPYSRFETVHERAVRAEEELRILKEQSSQNQNNAKYDGPLPEYWVKLYGDSDASKEAFTYEQQRLEEMQLKAAEKAAEVLQQRQVQKEQEVEKRVEKMEQAFDDFTSKSKRSFTDTEQSAVLDIMDEFTPKDENGMYLADPVQYLDKAVEIYDLRSSKSSAKKKEARQRVAGLTGGASEGTSENGRPWTGEWWNSPLLPKD